MRISDWSSDVCSSDLILACHAHRVIDCAARMPDLEAQVPQKIEHGLDHLLAPWRAARGCYEGDVDIRMRAHLRSTITANRDHGEPFGGAAIAHRIDMRGHMIVDHPDQLNRKSTRLNSSH